MSIRPSAAAGRWYPGNPEMLARNVGQYLDQAHVQIPPGRVWGVVVPHAGYYYSGRVAAYAFKCLRGLQPDMVAIVSPMYYPYHAPLLTTAHEAYETPLGVIEVDLPSMDQLNWRLCQRLGYGLQAVYGDPEHALEIELPFLQYMVGSFRLIPVMMGDQTVPVARALGQVLAEVLAEKQVLLVASSNLSQFYSCSQADRLDAELLRRLETFDPQGVIKAQEEGVGFATGSGAIAAVLWAAEQLGADQVRVLHHATSGDISGDFDSVVGYGAAVIW